MKKEKRRYYFSVEGETEKWYLEWLQDEINAEAARKYDVILDVKVQKDPLIRAKRLNILTKTEIIHIFDRESEEKIHVDAFQRTLDQMKAVQKLGKKISYKLGYSNYTFELWMILHKADCNGTLNHRSQYLFPLNRAYSEHFENLDQYKHENNFKRLLKKLSLGDVRSAVNRSKRIMANNVAAGHILQQYKGYSFYRENPSISLGDHIGKIMQDCELM